LANELKKYGYRAGFYPVTQVKNISALKDPIPSLEKSGIYKLECQCGDQYIGQTGRSIKTRFKEHLRDYKSLLKNSNTNNSSNSVSAMAQHCLQNNHNFNNVVVNQLHFGEKGRRLNRLEEIYTLHYLSMSNKVLNDTDCIFYNNFIRFMFKND